MLRFLSKVLRNIADDLDSGNSNLSAEDTLKVLNILDLLQNGDTVMSKKEACQYLDISRSTFDNLIQAGHLPKGEHLHEGIKSLFWYKSDLEIYKQNSYKN